MINEGYEKEEEYILNEDKSYTKRSVWTAAESVEFSDGENLQIRLGNVLGLVTELGAASKNGYIPDAKAVKSLIDTLTKTVNSNYTTLNTAIQFTNNMLPIALTQDQYNALSKSQKENGREYNIIG